MNNASVILAIALVLFVISRGIVRIIQASNGAKGSKAMQRRVDDLEGDLASMEQDLEEAQQRIEVLEKIVTDGKYDLNRQIDDLASK